MSETSGEKKRVTLRQVAREAGVSLKTASNVINENGRMADETRDKVRAVIERLGYRVNVAARNLNLGKTGFITLAVPSLTPPYLAELANRVIDAARARDYSVYVTTYGDTSEGAGARVSGARELLQSFNTTVSDGMILSISETEELTADDLDVDFPLVCLGSRSTHGVADHVTPDDVAAARDAAGYLFSRGARSLVVLGARGVGASGSDESSARSSGADVGAYVVGEALEATEGNAQLRLRGVLEACAEAGTNLDERFVTAGRIDEDWTIGAGAAAMERVLDAAGVEVASGSSRGRGADGSAPLGFDGVVAFNDQLALGALFTLAKRGVRVPEDVQVIGFDNNEEAAYFQPPLTTMDSCLAWTAPVAVQRLLERIAGDIQGDNPVQQMRTQAKVIARETTR